MLLIMKGQLILLKTGSRSVCPGMSTMDDYLMQMSLFCICICLFSIPDIHKWIQNLSYNHNVHSAKWVLMINTNNNNNNYNGDNNNDNNTIATIIVIIIMYVYNT